MMTNNLDQFDQSPDFDDAADDGAKRGGMKSNLAEAWKTKPIFKLIVLLIGLGGVVAAAMYFTASKPEAEISRVVNAPIMREPPGGKASPDFIAAQGQGNEQRIKEAATSGMGTALPTPLPSGISTEARKEGDPLVEFRAEMKRQKEEQTRQIQALQQQTQQQQQVSLQQDQQVQEKIGASLTQQMTQLATLWQPKPMNVIAGMVETHPTNTRSSDSSGQAATSSANGPTPQQPFAGGEKRKVKPLIAAGTVNYAQMLTEANSDVPGPILAQILSGPLSGARAIGKFVVSNDYMILTFNLATLKGKEYPIESFALDPDTTLGGMATEVDHRYFARVLLPAAASFIAAFGQKLGTKPTETTVTSQGVVISSQAESGIKDAMYAGMGSVGQSLSNFFAQEASNTRVLVRVAVGTPMGLFFVKAVCGGEYPCDEKDVMVSTASPPSPTKATPASMAAAGQ